VFIGIKTGVNGYQILVMTSIKLNYRFDKIYLDLGHQNIVVKRYFFLLKRVEYRGKAAHT
jgi:hypothetical protein